MKLKKGRDKPSILWETLLAKGNLEPNNWNEVDKLESGERITIYTKEGEKFESCMWSVGRDALKGIDTEDDTFVIRKEQIDEVIVFDSSSDTLKTVYLSFNAALERYKITLPEPSSNPVLNPE